MRRRSMAALHNKFRGSFAFSALLAELPVSVRDISFRATTPDASRVILSGSLRISYKID